MKISFKYFFSIVLLLFLCFACEQEEETKQTGLYQNGDLVFMRLDIGQIKSLKELSKTDYTHVGVVFLQGDSVFVYEASGVVALESLERWVTRKSIDSSYTVKRLKKEYRIKEMDKKLIHEAYKYKRSRSDVFFNWSDSLIYSSELVWKIFDRGIGVTLCDTKKMKDWDMNNEFVLRRVKAKYSNSNPFKPEETVVSPDDLFNSDKLELVKTIRVDSLLVKRRVKPKV